MIQLHFNILTISLLFAAPLLIEAQSTGTPVPAESAGFKEPPVLNACEIVLPDYEAGAHFKVQEPVPTYAGATRYKKTKVIRLDIRQAPGPLK